MNQFHPLSIWKAFKKLYSGQQVHLIINPKQQTNWAAGKVQEKEMTFLRSNVSYRRVFSSGLIMRYTVSHVGGLVATEMKNIVCCLTFYFTG